MATVNSYVTLAQFKAYMRMTSTDTADDAVIEGLLDGVSREIDDHCQRTFYPRYQARQYDTPEDTGEYAGCLELDDDLLSVSSLTNGDATAVTTAQYTLYPLNIYPKNQIKLLGSAGIAWTLTDDGDPDAAITVTGFWGYHDQYLSYAWQLATTAAEDIDISETVITMTSGTPFGTGGQIIKIESELMNVSAVSTNDVTVSSRGDNGSTAATHANGTAVYIWRPMRSIYTATLQFAESFYHKRFGENTSSIATVTAAGIVLSPADMPRDVAKALRPFVRGV